MAEQHDHRKIERDEADRARIKALRDAFQEDRPSLDNLVQSGECREPTTQGAYLEAKLVAHMLKEARKQAKMSLADASAASGMDRATISRLENAVYANTTINTLNRLAHAYGKHFAFRLEDDSELVRG